MLAGTLKSSKSDHIQGSGGAYGVEGFVTLRNETAPERAKTRLTHLSVLHQILLLDSRMLTIPPTLINLFQVQSLGRENLVNWVNVICCSLAVGLRKSPQSPFRGVCGGRFSTYPYCSIRQRGNTPEGNQHAVREGMETRQPKINNIHRRAILRA